MGTGLPGFLVEGVLAVQSGDNPRVVREKLDAYLPPAIRGTAANARGGGAAGGAGGAQQRAA